VGSHPVQPCYDFSGKVHIQRVDILGAEVADEEAGVVGGGAAPRSPEA
jgi:hypothetical protein